MDGPELKDCPLCGMPMEVITQWTGYSERHGHMVEKVTARCLKDHWFGGPLEDISA